MRGDLCAFQTRSRCPVSDEQIFPVSYQILRGQFTKQQLAQLDRGGCDAVIIHSLIFPKDGSRSEMIMTMGPDGEDLSAEEMFKSWVGLAHTLSQAPDLSPEKRSLADQVFQMVRIAILAAREKTPPPNTTA